MRWAFWRRRGEPAPGLPAPEPAAEQRPAPRPPRPEEPDDERRPSPAFSGAEPTFTPPPAPGDSTPPHLGDTSLVLSAAVRQDVLDLVRAALARDRDLAAGVLARLTARGADEAEAALVAALAPLGERFAALADSADPVAVLAQGELVAHRAEALLRRVAPGAPARLADQVVRLACGVAPADPAPQTEPAQDVLVAAVLLAQTVEDGAGDTDALAAEIADLLPDA